MGPSHFLGLENKCALSNYEAVDTPLGALPIEEQINSSLKSKSNFFISMSSSQDLKEHSLEMQFPLIFKMFQDNPIKILPIMVGHFTDSNVRKSVANALIESLEHYISNEIVFVISSDFCHFGKRFGFVPNFFDKNQSVNENISAMDQMGFSKLNSNTPIQDFTQYLESTGNTICGAEAILLYLQILEQSGIKGEWDIVDYAQSNMITNQNDHCVSYMGAVFKRTNR